jgi:CheY-like chemotaxis protein
MSDPSTPDLSIPELMGTRVLIVEDNDEHRYLLAAHLEKGGCTVTSTSSGEEAMERYATALPDIVFVDVQLPGMSGHDFVDWLRERGAPAPRIVTASVLDPSDHPMGDVALPKPFSRNHVNKILEDYVAYRKS